KSTAPHKTSTLSLHDALPICTPLAGTQTWFLGTGRRKEAIARVFLRAGSGKFTVNDRSVEQYFPNHAWKHEATEPLKFTNLADRSEEHTSELQSRFELVCRLL